MNELNELPALALAWMAGTGLGAIFFGGLWWTVRRSLASRRSALWLIGSLFLRMTVTVAGFYFAGQGHWERLAACLLGFVVARAVVICLTRSSGEARAAQGARHAS